MTLHPQSETSKLPVSLAPELLLAVHSDKGPLIADIAPRLASWTGHPVAELVGQPLDAVFHEVIPELPVVVDEVRAPQSFHGLLGHAPAFVRMLRKIEIYGPTDAPVLITGETGTGKELVA